MVKLRDNNAAASTTDSAPRLASLDALRGVLLLLLISGGFGIKEMLSDERWRWITRQWRPTDWAGCTLWDLLCPAFLLVVGIALPYSYANRQANGQSWARQFLHALVRASVLIALGMYLDSYFARKLTIDLRGDLQQLGLAYLIAFLVVPLGMPVQGVTIGFLLIGHTAAYVIYAFAAGHALWLPIDPHIGLALDSWLRLEPHAGKYVAFNTINAAAVVVLGVLIGGVVRSGLTSGVKVAILTSCSFVAILLGWVLSGGGGVTGEWPALIPMIRRLMTLTFVFTAVGWTLLIFTYFYLLLDAILLRSWALPLAILGRNSLVLYVTSLLCRGWAETSAKLVLPAFVPLQAFLVALIVLAIYWLFAFWLYRRRIFLKV